MKKKMLAAFAALSGSLVSLAEGTVTVTEMDTTAAEGMVKSAAEGLADFLGDCTPYLVTLLLAGLAVWAGIVIVRLVKRVFSRGS